MTKLLVSDFDRTLYRDCRISDEDLSAVRDWQARGHLFAIATGRDEQSIREKLAEWKLPADYYICNNGARITSRRGELLSQTSMDLKTVLSIADFLINQEDLSAAVTIADTRFKLLSRTGKDGYPSLAEQISLEDLRHKGAHILQLHCRCGSPPPAVLLSQRINTLHRGITAFANEWNVDIVNSSVDKGEATEFLVHHLNGIERVITIGDSLNDRNMIQRFHGFTIETANQAVKDIAALVYPSVARCVKSEGSRLYYS